jgi:enoyl-CoA hydratase
MPENELIVEKTGALCTLTFNRPERRNALSPLLLYNFAETLEQLKKEDEVRCVVLQGAGDKAFSSGYDITAIPTDAKPEVLAEIRKKNPLERAIEALTDFPYPTIAMVNGMAFGAGCEIAATCDIRIAVDTARMGMPPAKLGIVYFPAGLLRFINIIGLANAKELFFTGRYYSAARVKEMGLVHYLLPADQLVSFTRAMAEEISGNAPLALKGTKAIFRLCLKHQRFDPEDLRQAELIVAEAFRSEDLKEGQRAFFEKRKPVFKGR